MVVRSELPLESEIPEAVDLSPHNRETKKAGQGWRWGFDFYKMDL